MLSLCMQNLCLVALGRNSPEHSLLCTEFTFHLLDFLCLFLKFCVTLQRSLFLDFCFCYQLCGNFVIG